MTISVCLSVCPRATEHKSGTTRPIFAKTGFARYRSSSGERHDMLFTACSLWMTSYLHVKRPSGTGDAKRRISPTRSDSIGAVQI